MKLNEMLITVNEDSAYSMAQSHVDYNVKQLLRRTNFNDEELKRYNAECWLLDVYASSDIIYRTIK